MHEKKIDIEHLALPGELATWIGDASIFDKSGESGAKTYYVNCLGGAFLKISERDSLKRSFNLQKHFADHGLTSEVIQYVSTDRDYLLMKPVAGENGLAQQYLEDPKRLSIVFGESLRALHRVGETAVGKQIGETTGVLVSGETTGGQVSGETIGGQVPFERHGILDKSAELLEMAEERSFIQSHLDILSPFIGSADASVAAQEVLRKAELLQNDVLIHGDYCLPNIMLDDWRFTGFVDVGDAGLGDRHYDIAWGLWTLGYNLKKPEYGHLFLKAYGHHMIDAKRLRLCGILASMA